MEKAKQESSSNIDFEPRRNKDDRECGQLSESDKETDKQIIWTVDQTQTISGSSSPKNITSDSHRTKIMVEEKIQDYAPTTSGSIIPVIIPVIHQQVSHTGEDLSAKQSTGQIEKWPETIQSREGGDRGRLSEKIWGYSSFSQGEQISVLTSTLKDKKTGESVELKDSSKVLSIIKKKKMIGHKDIECDYDY